MMLTAVWSAGPVQASWAPPTAPELARLERALASWDAQYDPAEQMVRRPFSSPGYHTKLTGGFVHPTRDSLNYALGLLDTGRPQDLPRAVAILRRLIALQDADPKNPTFGIWSWFLEEPLPQMKPPDWNWADFNGVTLLQVSRDHRARLPADLAEAVDQAILRCCQAIKKRNVGPGYTNISIMGTYVTLVAGEHLGAKEFYDYGLERLRGISAFTQQNGTFEEYNSPAYTMVALQELSRLTAHVQNEEAQRLIAPLLRRAWEELATHFHAPTRQWAGPHSRAYDSLLKESTLAFIQRATAGRVNFGVDLPDREEFRLPVACPPDLEPLFKSLDSPRTGVETFIGRSQTVGTTYLHPDYALGTINHGDLWNQRRALLMHFKGDRGPGYLQMRFLKDGYDFASAWVHSSQREGLTVGVVNLVTDGGDTHVALDLVKDGKIKAASLRLRFELGGDASARITVSTGRRSATFQAGHINGEIQIPTARFDGRDATLAVGGDEGHKWLDVVLYEGESREFDLKQLNEAVIGYALAVGRVGIATSREEAGQLSVSCDELSASAPVKPGPRPYGDYHAPVNRAK